MIILADIEKRETSQVTVGFFHWEKGDDMAHEYAKQFYHSSRWKKARAIVMQRHFGLCQLCARPAKIVHHRRPITPENIEDDDITLNEDNLMCLCHDCHQRVHSSNGVTRDGLFFDSAGQLVKLEESDACGYPPVK